MIARFLSIETGRGQELPPRLVDAIGLFYRLDPRFFETYLLRKLVDQLSPAFGRNGVSDPPPSWMPRNPGTIREITEPRPLQPAFVALGPYVIATAIQSSVPVILIWGYPDTDKRHDPYRGLEMDSAPPFQRESLLKRPGNSDWIEVLTTICYKFLDKHQFLAMASKPNPAELVFVFVNINLVYLKAQCRLSRSAYLRLNIREVFAAPDNPDCNTWPSLRDEWFRLRRSIEDFEDSRESIPRFLRAQKADRCLSNEYAREVLDEIPNVIAEARRLEAELKDYMQFQIDNLALQESKKSIELSNAQIQEGRRGRPEISEPYHCANNPLSKSVGLASILKGTHSPFAVTILAFVYVPLNLATSIFGMNLLRLNSTGQDIQVFVKTALTISLVTLACWVFIIQWDNFAQWEIGLATRDRRQVSKNKCGFVVRLTMLAWLLRHGHSNWLWSSKAWIGLLTGDRFGTFQVFDRPANRMCESACDYVAKYYENEKTRPFDTRLTSPESDQK